MDSAFDEMFVQNLTKTQGALRNYVIAHVLNISIADDVLQEVALILWKKRALYQPDRPFLNWAMGVARNQILHSRRQAARSKLVFNGEMAEKFADRCEALEPELEDNRRALLSCVGVLSEENRKMLELRYEKRLPLADLAKALRRQVNAVTVALSRIRAVLAQCVRKTLNASADRMQEEPC